MVKAIHCPMTKVGNMTFSRPLSKKDVCPACGYLVPLLLSTALLTFPEM